MQRQIESLKLQDPFSDPSRTIDNAASDTEAGEESDHDRIAAQITELEERLADFRSAITRIEHGTYGICLNCGNPISPARLKAYPTATECISCQEAGK